MWIIAALLLSQSGAFPIPVAPAESVWVDIRGSGPTVVLVPGLAGSAFGYREVLRRLERRGYRAIVIEPLGVGHSSRPSHADYSLTRQAWRVAAALDSLGERGVLLVAHSVSASIALRLAFGRPELVRGLLLLDGGASESATTESFRRALAFAPLLRLPGGRARIRRELASQLARASGDRGWITEEVIDGYASPVLADIGASIAAFQRMARAREPQPLREMLHHLEVPVVLLAGGFRNKEVGAREADIAILRQRLRTFDVLMLDGAGHYVHEERPDAVIAAVERLSIAEAGVTGAPTRSQQTGG